MSMSCLRSQWTESIRVYHAHREPLPDVLADVAINLGLHMRGCLEAWVRALDFVGPHVLIRLDEQPRSLVFTVLVRAEGEGEHRPWISKGETASVSSTFKMDMTS